MAKINIKTFKFGKLFVGISFPTKSKSMWITRSNKNRNRMDHLLSLHRTFNRDKKIYTYTIILYKLNIKWTWLWYYLLQVFTY